MRDYFAKLGMPPKDSNIDIDDFDFTTFGSTNITSLRTPPMPHPRLAPEMPAVSISINRN